MAIVVLFIKQDKNFSKEKVWRLTLLPNKTFCHVWVYMSSPHAEPESVKKVYLNINRQVGRRSVQETGLTERSAHYERQWGSW